VSRSDYNQGFTTARDRIIAEIIGLQNDCKAGRYSKEYETYQKVLKTIIDIHGPMFSEFKG